MSWVPLMRASPSLASRTRGSRPRACRTSPAPTRAPAGPSTCPSPMSTSARWASGARSPLAPTEPRPGIHGVTSASSSHRSWSMTSGRTPECPPARLAARRITMPRASARLRGGPQPTAWLRIRLRCSSSSCAPGDDRVGQLPEARVDPVDLRSSPVSRRRRISRQVVTRRRASSPSRAGRSPPQMARKAGRSRVCSPMTKWRSFMPRYLVAVRQGRRARPRPGPGGGAPSGRRWAGLRET